MNENPRNPIHRVQLGSACVDSKGGQLSEDGLQRSSIGLFGGPDWSMPMAWDWNAGCARSVSGGRVQVQRWEGAILPNDAVQQVHCAPAPPPSRSPFLRPTTLQNGFWLHKTKGIWSIKPNAFCVMAFLSRVSKIRDY